MKRYGILLALCVLGLGVRRVSAQPLRRPVAAVERWLEPADTLHKKRFWISTAIGTTIYGTASAGLWFAWYRDYPVGSFRFYNDWGEWRNVDKAGHLFTAWNEARWIYGGARWTGMNNRQAAWAGAAVGFGLQATIEIMDGFSAQYGFSVPDLAFNTLGAGAFLVQQLTWEEQRIVWKVSNSYPRYPDVYVAPDDGSGPPMRLSERAAELYGTGMAGRFIKDYNGMTVWASVNLSAFASAKKGLPPWLNLAVGYGAENLYGGYSNAWPADDPRYFLPEDRFPRYSQLYVSPDIDLTRIPTRSRLLKLLFGAINFVKIPAPALELNTLGELRWHWLYW